MKNNGQLSISEKIQIWRTNKYIRRKYGFLRWTLMRPKGGWMVMFIRGTDCKEWTYVPMVELREPRTY